ncbi:hypothetical protein, partial [Leclercia adecarboxylata]|uniref:hypothetical protein n=1 Tax=Leclercia adecarboxylata TaxID=83655 RepID=UPI00234C745D
FFCVRPGGTGELQRMGGRERQLGLRDSKLNRPEQAKALSIMRLRAGGGEVRLFSALKRQGVEGVAQLLWQWAHPAGSGAAQDAPAPPAAAPGAPEDTPLRAVSSLILTSHPTTRES